MVYDKFLLALSSQLLKYPEVEKNVQIVLWISPTFVDVPIIIQKIYFKKSVGYLCRH